MLPEPLAVCWIWEGKDSWVGASRASINELKGSWKSTGDNSIAGLIVISLLGKFKIEVNKEHSSGKNKKRREKTELLWIARGD